MSVREPLGLRIRKGPRAEIRARVDELLALVGLTPWAAQRPDQLSGAQRQRMALAGALAVAPRVLWLDEPFGALDASVRAELRQWLRRLHHEQGVATVLVTHDQEEARPERAARAGTRGPRVRTPAGGRGAPLRPGRVAAAAACARSTGAT